MPPTPSPSPFLVELVRESGDVSWIGPTLMSGLFLVLGALLAFLSTFLSDSRRAKREQQERFRDEVLAVSSRLVVAAGDLYKHVSTLDHLIKMRSRLHKGNEALVDTTLVLESVLDAVESINSDVGMLRLIASDNVRDAATALVLHAGKMGKLAASRSPELSDAAGRLLELDVAFQDVVRDSLTKPG